jgi:hypothetical protein
MSPIRRRLQTLRHSNSSRNTTTPIRLPAEHVDRRGRAMRTREPWNARDTPLGRCDSLTAGERRAISEFRKSPRRSGDFLWRDAQGAGSGDSNSSMMAMPVWPLPVAWIVRLPCVKVTRVAASLLPLGSENDPAALK